MIIDTSAQTIAEQQSRPRSDRVAPSLGTQAKTKRNPTTVPSRFAAVNGYRLELDGPSMRKIKASEASEPAAQSPTTTGTDGKPAKGAKK